MTDANLVSAHLAGDPNAIRVLEGRHRSSVMGFLVGRVGDEAEDLYQEVWGKVSRGMVRYKEKGSFRAWILQIARRQVVDHWRRRQARVPLDLTAEEVSSPVLDTPEDNMVARQTEQALGLAMRRLSSEVEQVVRWRLQDGVPFAEIARRQNIPLNTALARMHRGLNQIRSTLTEQGVLGEQL